MRVLHFVEGGSGHVVLETSDGHERFELTVDAALRAAVDATPATARATTAAGVKATPSSEPRISPREIQMRVRAGESPQELAETFDTGLDWVLRFAGPVLAERARMADEARRAKARRSTTEGQTVVFGEAVDERFAAHGIDPASVGWDAVRREDGQWIVSADWVGGQTERSAEWTFHLSARTVAPIDDTAADLLSDHPIRPIVAPEPAGPPSLALAPPLDAALVPFLATPDAHTGRLPHPEEVFDQSRFDEPGPEGFSEPHLPMHVPDLPPAPAARLTNLGVAARNDETEDEKAARASIPSWDDILLGVRRKQD